MMRFAIVCFPGFAQWAGPDTGIFQIHDTLRHTYHDRRESLILLRKWNTDPRETAELLDHHRVANVFAIGYSYGTWAVCRLAEALDRHGKHLDVAFLIGPVPRFTLLPLKLISMTYLGNFEVPPSIREVHSWRQVNDRPAERHVVAVGQATTVHTQVVYGTARNLKRRTGRIEAVDDDRRIDAKVGHGSIDDRKDIKRRIGSALAERVHFLRQI